MLSILLQPTGHHYIRYNSSCTLAFDSIPILGPVSSPSASTLAASEVLAASILEIFPLSLGPD